MTLPPTQRPLCHRPSVQRRFDPSTEPAARLLGLPEALRLATLPRNITSPLAMAICSMVGADASLAIAIVVITGVIGANFGATVLDALG